MSDRDDEIVGVISDQLQDCLRAAGTDQIAIEVYDSLRESGYVIAKDPGLAQTSGVSTDDMTINEAAGWSRGWNDCRETMLSTSTAQQQRIEALEAVLRHAVSVHGGSRGSQHKWLEHAQELLSDEALNEATQTQHNDPFYPIDPHSYT